jgi:hypothetical protein
MNAIQKATFAASALAITVVGALLVTAPMAFAHPVPVTTHNDCSTPSLQIALAGHDNCNDVSRDAGLFALNRK